MVVAGRYSKVVGHVQICSFGNSATKTVVLVSKLHIREWALLVGVIGIIYRKFPFQADWQRQGVFTGNYR